jgi:predicted N-acetyltransferase YhbS
MAKTNYPANLRPLDLNRDLNAVADLVALCFADSLDEDGFRFIRKMRQAAISTSISGVVSMMGLPQHGFVWEENGLMIGNISIVTILYNNRPAYLIANVAVHPEHRRQGIARNLTEATLEFINSRKVPVVLLHVNENNPVAFKLYQDFGFKEISRRTTWLAHPDKTLKIEDTGNMIIRQRSSKDWTQQKKWLAEIYPKTVTWHMPYKEHLLRPGFITHLSRLLGDQSIRQWSALKDGKLIGTLSWQSSRSMADWIWLAVDHEESDLAIYSLLVHAKVMSRPGRRISVNYPAGENIDAFTKSGFKQHHTLIWMKF